MSRRHARTARTVSVAAAVALLITLALACILPAALLHYGFIARLPATPDTFWTDGVRGGHYIRQHHPLFDWVQFRRILFVGPAENQPYYMKDPPPRWAAVVSLDQREGFEEVWTGAFGWPWRALRCEQWQAWPHADQPGTGMVRGGWDIYGFPARMRLIIPYFPIWPGLLGDLLLFSAAWLVALAGLRLMRQRRRHRRGLCAACGYDMRACRPGDSCPECGDIPRFRDAPPTS